MGGAKHPLLMDEPEIIFKLQSTENIRHKCYKNALPQQVNEIDLTELTNIIKIASQNMCVNGITATITQKANG